MALVWVIGSGGMLGQALVNELSQTEDSLFKPAIKFNWANPAEACEQIKQVASQFSKEVGKDAWVIHWAAGTGTMHSSEEELQTETNLLDALINNLLGDENINLQSGKFIFASSAGAIYAGAQEGVITESTEPAPINAYGRTKLLQEAALKRLNQDGKGASVVACRISTLYGFKSKDAKQQGLIAEMVSRSLANQVIHIYVPLETMRDYITPKDAAIQMIDMAINVSKSPYVEIKIVASGVSKSIAEIISILKRICKRNLRIVTQADMKSSQYQRVVQFKSEFNRNNNRLNQMNLIEGMAGLFMALQKDIVKLEAKPRSHFEVR